MKLEFKKNEGKKHIITYCRDDGSKTWMYADEFFIRHDLNHYAIEKKLGYKTAFYGMINSGIELSDFLDKKKRDAMKFTNEAVHAESTANLFLIDKFQGRIENFNKIQEEVLRTSFTKVEIQHLTEAQIDNIRNYFSELLSQWNQLRPKESLKLEIDI